MTNQIIVIWGTGKISNMLAKEAIDNNIKVLAFVDNDYMKYNLYLNNIEICSPEWLVEHSHEIDYIVLGFEGRYEEDIKKQMSLLKLGHDIKIVSWRELVLEM